MENYIDNLSRLSQIEDELKESIKTTTLISKDELSTKIKGLLTLSFEFLDKRDKIKKEFASISSITIKDKKLRTILEKISLNKDFYADYIIKSLEQVTGEKSHFESLHGDNIDIDNLDWAQLDEIASNELYSWWGPYDYIWGLVEIGILVVGVSIPSNLSTFLNEARHCYAFKQYNAVFSLCRTLLESSMRDVGIRKGKIKKINGGREFYKEYPPRRLINTTTTGKLFDRVHDFYAELSSLIHGYETVNSDRAKSALKETISIIQKLYSNAFDK